MKKKFSTFFVGVFTLVFGLFNKVVAQQFTNTRIPNPTVFDSAEDVINAGASLIRPAFIISFGAMIFYGAYTWLTAGGDDEKVGRARKIITAAIIGFALAIFSPTIVNFISQLLGVEVGTTF